METADESPAADAITAELTPRQAAFVLEYLRDFNGTQAAIRAGYSPNTANEQASRLLADVNISAAVQAKVAARMERTEVDVDFVVNGAREVFERCLQKRAVMVRRGKEFVQAMDDDGRHVWQFDAKGANGALSILAKHVRLGGPDVSLNIDLDKLSPAQLEHIANGGSLATLPVA